ncbi:thiamine diphosphokinase [bacterium]|nr:thiamine diphosphokinase [bacterium]
MIDNPKRAILFVNGDLPEADRFRATLTDDDILIAVDGGLRHLAALGLKPDLIIGDLDSADPAEVHRYRSNGVDIRQFPSHKNQTDLELALEAALKMGAQSIRVVAAVGGRLDQTLGNIFLLTQPDLANVDIHLVDGRREVFLIRDKVTLHGQPDDIVSLLPLMGPVTGVLTTDLAYPLNRETLYPDHTRGISNQMTGDTCQVAIESGILLCIHQFNTPNTK